MILSQRQRLVAAGACDVDSTLKKLFIVTHDIRSEEYIYFLEMEVTYKKSKAFIKLVDRRLKGEPVSHIIGYRFFWKDKFFVNHEVLDPRPESELIVEIGKDFLFDGCNVLDMGAGSGCLGLSLHRENPKIKLTLADVSKPALLIAKKNAKKNAKNCKTICSNLFENIDTKYHLIVSNLPYIKSSVLSSLDLNVVLYEPHQALIGGEYGEELIFKFLDNVSPYLLNGGVFIIEIGKGQIDTVETKLQSLNFLNYTVYKDINGISRTICVKKDTK